MLLNVIKSWQGLYDDQQTTFIRNASKYFCSLNFLVGLADEAETFLKVWENILFNGPNIGYLNHRVYTNKESCLRRTVCKPVQYRDCQMSERMFAFKIFM